ncbi:cyanocobalamin reductase / alkylcobalamin dealkylase-like [Ornithodoros turicata]|uniref:Cyanocobalamin reductase (cyanide-eliminating) n=1 Tax=Ornithodoros turicata TaxID=34597 RepID=A0A2R5LBV4_9ACAR
MELNAITGTLDEILSPYAIEVHPFKVSWYNECVPGQFKFVHHPDTLCYVAVSTPSTFEKAFLPLVLSSEGLALKDPFDECMTLCFSRVKEVFPEGYVQVIQDFELHPNRRPKALMQTASHVSGAAYYYTCKGVDFQDVSPKDKKLLGVCIHPKYGGWFALRAVLLFPEVQVPHLERRQPIDVVGTFERRLELLKLFNFHWRDGRYRDIVEVQEKYSDKQREYFAATPGQRWTLIEKWRRETRNVA